MLQNSYPSFKRCRVFVQSNPSIATERIVKRASREISHMGLDNVVQVYQPLSEENYREQLLNSDLILLPYDSYAYARRSSGIFVEAMALGIPTIIPKGSWMETQVKNNEKEDMPCVLFEDAEDLGKKLLDILQNYSLYKNGAEILSGEWRERHNASRLIEVLIEKDDSHKLKI